MNKLFLTGLLALILPAWAAAQISTGTEASQGIGIEQTGVLVYPASMTAEGVFSGEVRAVISVDAEGNLTDWLLTAYTQPTFADVAMAAIRRWRYLPATVNGRRQASRAHILFEFRTEGVVVQTLPGALVKQMFPAPFEERYLYKTCRLRELDRIPTPVHVVAPSAKLDGPPRSVTVEFYIDEEGRVRMPAVDREAADDMLAAASVAAVEQWRFEPPLRRGRPVLVYAQQEFTFRPKLESEKEE